MTNTIDRQIARLAQLEWVWELTFYARGDPQISSWDEQFLASMAHLVAREIVPSRKQAAQLDRIAVATGFKNGAPAPASPFDNDNDYGDGDGDGDNYDGNGVRA